jgi:hypothetical protein
VSTTPRTPLEISSLIHASGAALRAEAEALDDDALRWHPGPGEWCLNEVLGHVIEAEQRGFAGQIRRILEKPGRPLPTWDQEIVARERRDCERSGHALMVEFSELREEGIATLLALQPEEVQLAGEHVDVGTLHIVDLMHEWVHHDREHLKQAMTIVQALAWPHMGNAQRFSEPG